MSKLFSNKTLNLIIIIGVTFLGCLLVAALIHEPIPRIQDEFSYLLMSDTFSHGHLVNPPPPLSEFFDTFHELMHPAYVSKYFPAQGIFLAIGEKLTGHPAVGVWLSSALACGATYWMLGAWIDANWALFGAVIIVLQYGIYGYWSQTYWGGMVAALGGALAFGAIRRLWNALSWQNTLWLGVGLVILANSRPLEGLIAAFPIVIALAKKFVHQKIWYSVEFWVKFIIPIAIVLTIGGVMSGSYNRTITGSFWTPPYILHEEQYQETPQFVFQPMRPKITYSSSWVRYYYDHWEMQRFERQRNPKSLITVSAGKIVSWWYFFCGLLLTPCLVLPGLLSNRDIRYKQTALAAGLFFLWMASNPTSFLLRGLFDFLVLLQVVLLWEIFDSFWERLALLTISLLLIEICLVKWFFPHYVAPVACLILYLQIEGARRVWKWKHGEHKTDGKMSRSQRRRLRRKRERDSSEWTSRCLHGYVRLLPVLCILFLVLRISGRVIGWKDNEFNTDNLVLPINDWSSRRADLERWLNEQPGRQLVFVAYSGHHNVNFEWVYNHADLRNAHVIWARNLGPEHNRELLNEFHDRTIWLLEADRSDPQLIPYSEFDNSSLPPRLNQQGQTPAERHSLNW